MATKTYNWTDRVGGTATPSNYYVCDSVSAFPAGVDADMAFAMDTDILYVKATVGWTSISTSSVGIVGPIGPTGPPGATGAPGTPGEKWYSGVGTPNNTTGIVGDWYIDTDTGDIYEKTGTSAWTLRTNITGPPGPPGPQGEGLSLRGSVPSSDDLPPTGIPGDAWIASDTGHLWIWDDSTDTWVDAGVVEGPIGPVGPPGPEGPIGPEGPQGPQGIPGEGADLTYSGDYVAATYNDGDIVVAADGVAYMCVVDGTTTPPEPWPGSKNGVLALHHTTHEAGGTDAIVIAKGTAPYTFVAINPTGTINNWAPGLSGNTVIRWFGSTDTTLTGIAGGVAGQIVTIQNAAIGGNLFLAHDSSGSLSANRLMNVARSAATPVGAFGSVTYYYEGTFWVMIAHEQGAWVGVPYSAANFGASGGGTWTVGSGAITTYAYMLAGKTLTMRFACDITTIAGTVNRLELKSCGFTIAASTAFMANVSYANSAAPSSGNWISGGMTLCEAGGTSIYVYYDRTIAWPVGNTYLSFTTTFQVI